MKGLLARLNQQNNTSIGTKGVSRSASIASSIDDQDDQQSNSDESQSQQTSNTLKPEVRKDKKTGWNTGAKEAKPKVASRINTNMVKLKLLDATRKAIIDKTKKQFVSSYAQTDTFKTKLCKDQSIETQADLVNPVDQSTETEIEFVAHKAKDGTLIVTATCASNTDNIVTESVSTQTAMPRSDVAFKKFMRSKHTVQYADDDDWSNEDDTDYATREIVDIESRLRSKKKLSRQKSSPRSNIEIFVEGASSSDVTAEASFESTSRKELVSSKKLNDSDSEFEDSIQEDQPDVLKGNAKRAKSTSSTFNSWQDIPRPSNKVELPRSYFTDGPTPWSNFKDLVLGQRFLNARLSIPQRQFYSNAKQDTWSESQVKIVSDLIKEANALMEMFDQVAMLLGPDIKLHNVSDVEEFELPPSRYGGELAESCDKLEASLKRLQDIKPN